ncbi:uncharacterized protein [Henckelia pumila]|uniref:uncharacterized protein n=1 Tax=Henckelia pumila TaxID=405737 RepID=UPI003C6E4D50
MSADQSIEEFKEELQEFILKWIMRLWFKVEEIRMYHQALFPPRKHRKDKHLELLGSENVEDILSEKVLSFLIYRKEEKVLTHLINADEYKDRFFDPPLREWLIKWRIEAGVRKRMPAPKRRWSALSINPKRCF